MNSDEMVNRATMIRDFPADQKRRERLRALGVNQLSNPELIANLLSMFSRMIAGFGGLVGLARSSFAELCETNGISEAKVCQILSAFELGRLATFLLPDDRAIIRTPADIHNLLGAEMSMAAQQKLEVVLLNTKAEVVSAHEVYQGHAGFGANARGRIAETGGAGELSCRYHGPQPSFWRPKS